MKFLNFISLSSTMKSVCCCAFLLFFRICSVQSDDGNDTKIENIELTANDTKLNLIKYRNVCGESIRETQFLLESPNYPENYPLNSNCEITLESDGECPVYFKFRFLDFDVETSPGCTKDRLEIGLEDAVCGFKNGTKTYLVKNGTLKLRFISDNEITGKGYKILVTKIEECVNQTQDSPNVLLATFPKQPELYPNLDKCCIGNSERSKHFFLKSPGFPYSMSSMNDCVLEITKSSPEICRIRIQFHFFWFGNSLDCREGFLEIDGKIICGCKKELNLITTFNQNNVKILRFKSEGLVKNSYSGFIAEIYQDECPKKVENYNRDKRFLLNKYLQNNYPNTRYDVYIFSYPGYENRQKETEETNFVEVETMEDFQGNSVETYPICLQWNQLQFDTIFTNNEIRFDECGKNEINTEKKCLEFHDSKGFLISPGYPFFYTGNLNECYRFLRTQGQCALRIHFLDFRIGFSEVCSEDKVELGKEGVYCGTSLFNRIVTLRFGDLNFIDMNFVSTTPKCFQGFKALFEQIPCREIITEQPPPRPITRIIPIEPSTTFTPPLQCSRLIREQFFTINKEDSLACEFFIQKYSERVCRLLIDLEQFSLDCSQGKLVVNGEVYCGNQQGRKINIEFRNTPIKISYEQFVYPTDRTFFRINGIQDTTNCNEPEVPAQISK